MKNCRILAVALVREPQSASRVDEEVFYSVYMFQWDGADVEDSFHRASFLPYNTADLWSQLLEAREDLYALEFGLDLGCRLDLRMIVRNISIGGMRESVFEGRRAERAAQSASICCHRLSRV